MTCDITYDTAALSLLLVLNYENNNVNEELSFAPLSLNDDDALEEI